MAIAAVLFVFTVLKLFMSFNSAQQTALFKWFYIQKPNPAAKLRLFCFPYAGGGTSIFRNWYQSLPDTIEVVAIRAPGRENRLSEQPISSLSALVEEIFQHIQPLLNKPFIFFGHSNGALICFELARLLQRKQMAMPNGVILSAKSPPHIAKSTKNISQLPDSEFLAELQDMNGTPLALLQNHELMELLMPMLRADFSLSENLIYQHDITLQCPATLIYGAQDKITIAQIMAWQDLLQHPVKLVELSGGHFFIDEQRDQLLSVLRQMLTESLSFINFPDPHHSSVVFTVD